MINVLVVSAATIALAGGLPLAEAPPSTPTVVALWALDELSGASETLDSSGGAHNGVPTGVTMGTDGYYGTAYSFRGGGQVRVPDAADLNPGTQPIQISAYLRVPATLGVGDYNVLQKGKATAVGGAYKLEVFAKAGTKFGFPDCAFNGARGRDRAYGPRSIADGGWHRVICTLSDTEAYVTVDGVDGPRVRRTVTSISNTTDITLGGKPHGSQYYEGDLDEVSISIG